MNQTDAMIAALPVLATPSGCDVSKGQAARQKFSAEEDALLVNLVRQYGTQNWKCVMIRLPGRTARQCRERFKYYLEPSLNKSLWTEPEDRMLMIKYTEFGRRWAQIATYLPNRTPIDLKNRFNLLQRSKQKRIMKLKDKVAEEERPAVQLPPIDTFLEMIESKKK